MFSKCNFYIIKLKRNFFAILFSLFCLSLILFSKSNLPAVKNGLNLWANSVVPSLFPFFIATNLLLNTNVIRFSAIAFNKIMKPCFNVNGSGAFCFVMGLISGYPIGAKIACDYRKNNICSKEECERLLSFTNNSGPLFVIGTVGINMFGNSLIGFLLFLTHILSGITVGIIFRFWKYKIDKNDNTSNLNKKNSLNNKFNSKYVNFNNLGEVISESINSSVLTIVMIGGFIVLFSCIISILNSSGIFKFLEILLFPIFNFFKIDTEFIKGILTGLLEITNGINIISNIHIKNISINIIITSLLLGFGGISVLLQVISIVSKTDISIKPYIYGKILQGIISALYTYIFINSFSIFNFNL